MGNIHKKTEEEIRRINELQRRYFDQVVDIFEQPLPEDVVERLEHIVAAGEIREGDTVLDVGAGTGALTPMILSYKPAKIIACDLSGKMLESLKHRYPSVETYVCDVRDLSLPHESVDVTFINALFGNIADKHSALANLRGIMKPSSRLIISHPQGRMFIEKLKGQVPFSLDSLPDFLEGDRLLSPYGFEVVKYIDEAKLYIILAKKQESKKEKWLETAQ